MLCEYRVAVLLSLFLAACATTHAARTGWAQREHPKGRIHPRLLSQWGPKGIKLSVAKVSGHGAVPVLGFSKMLSYAIGNPWQWKCPTVHGGTANLDRLSTTSTYYLNDGSNCYKFIPGKVLQMDDASITSATDCSTHFGTGTVVSLGSLNSSTSTSIAKQWEDGTFDVSCSTGDSLRRATLTGLVSTTATAVSVSSLTQPTTCDYAIVLTIPASELCKGATIAS